MLVHIVDCHNQYVLVALVVVVVQINRWQIFCIQIRAIFKLGSNWRMKVFLLTVAAFLALEVVAGKLSPKKRRGTNI